MGTEEIKKLFTQQYTKIILVMANFTLRLLWSSSPRWSWCFKGHFMLMHRPLKTVRALTRSIIVHLSLTLQAFAPPAPKMCGTMNSARKHVTQDVDKEMAWKLLLYKHLEVEDIVQHKFE